MSDRILSTQLQPGKLDLSRLPRKPYCTNSLDEGLKVRPLEIAITHKYIQVNHPKLKSFLVFDVDYPGAALAPEDANLPMPTLTVINPANMHAHIIYALRSPVSTSVHSREKPIKYLNAIYQAYVELLEADPGYSGLIAKNPLHPHWLTIESGNVVYDLAELVNHVDLTAVSKKTIVEGEGRNSTIFKVLRLWSYQAIKRQSGSYEAWFAAVMVEARKLNCFESAQPLPDREVVHIARSVSRWTWRNIKPIAPEYVERTHTSEAQRARVNKQWDSKQDEGLQLINAGLSDIEVAKLLGVNRKTVFRWRVGNFTDKMGHA